MPVETKLQAVEGRSRFSGNAKTTQFGCAARIRLHAFEEESG
jgi:hypothetical protein